MVIRKGRRHKSSVDARTVWLDSLNEATALERFVNQYGFAGKWDRSEIGIKHAHEFYTPDFELSVADGSNTSRAIVEVKEYRRDCTKDMLRRMVAVAGHYHTTNIFLYTVIKDEWYRINIWNATLENCPAPLPGLLNIDDLIKPWRFKVRNYYGRTYYQSFADSLLSIFNPRPIKRYKKR